MGSTISITHKSTTTPSPGPLPWSSTLPPPTPSAYRSHLAKGCTLPPQTPSAHHYHLAKDCTSVARATTDALFILFGLHTEHGHPFSRVWPRRHIDSFSYADCCGGIVHGELCPGIVHGELCPLYA